MEKKTGKYLALFFALCMIPVLMTAVFSRHGGLTPADWLTFSGAVLSYVGTAGISLVALYQSERANLLSEKVYMLTQREYAVNFSVEKIETNQIQRCKPQRKISNRITFCEVDATPETCRGYVFTIKNYSDYPITHMRLSTSYPIGRKRVIETLEKELDILLAPHEAQELMACNTPVFRSAGAGITFRITCWNIYGNSSSLELELRSTNAEGNVSFSSKLIESGAEAAENPS